MWVAGQGALQMSHSVENILWSGWITHFLILLSVSLAFIGAFFSFCVRCWPNTDVGCSVAGQVLQGQALGIWARLLIAKQEIGIRVFRTVSGHRDVFQGSWAGWWGCGVVLSPHTEINLYLIKHDKIMPSVDKGHKESQCPVLICPAVHPGHGTSATAERQPGQSETEGGEDFTLSVSSFFLSLEIFSHVGFSIKFKHQVSSYTLKQSLVVHTGKNMWFWWFLLVD